MGKDFKGFVLKGTGTFCRVCTKLKELSGKCVNS